jgi:hypothetical protein
MATIRFHLRPLADKDTGTHNICIRIIHKRKTREITTGYSVLAHEWDDKQQCFIFPDNDPSRKEELMEITDQIAGERKSFQAILQKLGEEGDYDIKNIIKEFCGTVEKVRFSDFVENQRAKLIRQNQPRTARAYGSVVNSLKTFTNGEDIYLNQITLAFINKYERYLKKARKSPNTISFYLRNLRAIFNKSIQEGRISKPIENPFGDIVVYSYKPKAKQKTKQKTEQKEMNDTSDKLSLLVDKTSKYLTR